MSLLPTSVPTNSTTATDVAQNSTYGSACSQIPADEQEDTVVLVCLSLITALGIVFNVFVLMVFCLHKKPCTVAEIYLSNLAAADLFLMSSLPFWVVHIYNRYNWIFGRFLCKVVNVKLRMNMFCSIYFLALVSIDRYVALVHPMSNNRLHRPKFAKLCCLLVWGLGLLLGVPTFIYREVQSHCDYTLCYLNFSRNSQILLYEGIETVIFIIPTPIIFFCSVKIIQALNNQPMVGLNSQKMEHKAATLVLVVLLAFLICWVPFLLHQIVIILSSTGVLPADIITEVFYTCFRISLCLALFNSTLNPLLYIIVGKNFQKKVKELFKQWNGGVTSNMTT